MSTGSPFLQHLDVALIEQAYRNGAGNEIDSGKMSSPESSAALAANSFGFFLNRPEDLPPMPGAEDLGWPATDVKLEACVRFPWRGGRHPWLDVLIETDSHLIGVESKRFEPFRGAKTPLLSDAYLRNVWGTKMGPVEALRDSLRGGDNDFAAIDATQLIKHSFALRTESHRRKPPKPAVLIYLYAEPTQWPGGESIHEWRHNAHVEAIERYADKVAGSEVGFRYLTYKQLLASWEERGTAPLKAHTEAIKARFAPF
jgi:hypothetical protein